MGEVGNRTRFPPPPRKRSLTVENKRHRDCRELSASFCIGVSSPSMKNTKIFTMPFSRIYLLYIQKAERKNRSKDEVDEVIRWLTGYDQKQLRTQIDNNVDFKTFFADAPKMHPNASKITGVICGYRIEEIEDPLMKKIRYLDKLIDELAKGRAMEKILRA